MTFPINQKLSLVIPRVFPQWVDEETIIKVFDNQSLGKVYKVSIIRLPENRRRNYPIYKAYVYFSAWYENEIAYNFQQRILKGRGEARVMYDDPWFWVVFKNNEKRLSKNDRRIMRLENENYHIKNHMETLEDRISKLEEIYFQQLEDTALYAAESVLYNE